MAQDLFRRLGTLLISLFVAALLVFLVVEVLPGDPARTILGLDAPESAVTALRTQLGLDEPAPLRFFTWLGGMALGDFGQSYAYRSGVGRLVADRLAVTLPLALMALALTVALALAAGVYAASRRGRAGDTGVMLVSQLGIAVPNFWLGILLIIVFAVWLRWLPAGGFPGWDAGIWPCFRALLLPAVSLALVQAAILARVTRAAVLDVMEEDFMRTAQAKGLSRRAALWRHALRNALIPVLTILGLQTANLLAGTVVIENVFQLPGLGRLVFQAIAQRDVIVVKSVVVLLVAMVVVVNFAVDLLYMAVDPRLRVAA